MRDDDRMGEVERMKREVRDALTDREMQRQH